MSDELYNRILVGDVLEQLATLPDESVHCVVTSPPYWGLRDYGLAPQVWGGDRDHSHEWREGTHCRCGAWRGQLGLEPTVGMYVDHVVDVFREVHRVLRKDGTLWLNMGDSYIGSGRGGVGESSGLNGGHHSANESRKAQDTMGVQRLVGSRLKRKDLVGQAWRVALALQEDGWWLRSDIIWEKPSVTPESAKDRPTKSHEYLFVLAKRVRYYFDAEAIAEDVTGNAHARGNGVGPKTRVPSGWDTGPGLHRALQGRYPRPRQNADFQAAITELVDRRNVRTVWRIPAQPFPGAHFATFPEELAARCIAAGTSAGGVCEACGAPWQRRVAKSAAGRRRERASGGLGRRASRESHGLEPVDGSFREGVVYGTVGWRPSCGCDAGVVPAVVLDPFLGSGTTALVALKMGRRYVGIELSPEYVAMAEARLRAEVPLLMEAGG